MKLSHITLGVLILGASLGHAQVKNKQQPKQDSTKLKCKNPNTKTVQNKNVPDSTLKIGKSKRYCPACGMG